MLPRIERVEADGEARSLLATFATGERRRYDVGPLLGRGIFQRITRRAAFVAVGVDEMGGVVWESGPDLSRDTIYLAGEPAYPSRTLGSTCCVPRAAHPVPTP